MKRKTITTITLGFSLAIIALGMILQLKSETPEQESNNISRTSTVSLPSSIAFAGEEVPIKHFYVREALDRELTVNTYWHSSTLSLFKLANRWFPLIEGILKEYDIPEDLKYLALIESGLRQVVSPSGAAGFWQFLEPTAKDYGLEVNGLVDERFHVEKASRAACEYLLKAHKKFQSWTLAAASYNIGMSGLDKEIERQKSMNYHDLSLNEETARYVYRAIALKIIFEDPQSYGFYIEEKHLYQGLETKEIEIKSSIYDLALWAKSRGSNLRVLKELNPWLMSDRLLLKPGRSYTLLLPESS